MEVKKYKEGVKRGTYRERRATIRGKVRRPVCRGLSVGTRVLMPMSLPLLGSFLLSVSVLESGSRNVQKQRIGAERRESQSNGWHDLWLSLSFM